MQVDKIVQQGELIILPISSIPKGQTSLKKDYIVAHSESGSHHVLEGEVEVIEAQDEIFLNLRKAVQLVHRGGLHPTKKVEPGKYQVIHKTEYNPANKFLERVQD